MREDKPWISQRRENGGKLSAALQMKKIARIYDNL
jgi:hypothetical protein